MSNTAVTEVLRRLDALNRVVGARTSTARTARDAISASRRHYVTVGKAMAAVER